MDEVQKAINEIDKIFQCRDSYDKKLTRFKRILRNLIKDTRPKTIIKFKRPLVCNWCNDDSIKSPNKLWRQSGGHPNTKKQYSLLGVVKNVKINILKNYQ